MSLYKDLDLKEAVLSLPSKEKDKLLIRLINKDKMLIKQLHFQLLETPTDLEDRIESLRESLTTLFENTLPQISLTTSRERDYRTLNLLLRNCSGMITEHEKITKDKFSEVEFRILILFLAFKHFGPLYSYSISPSAAKLHVYTAGRIKATIAKYDKLHEDLQFDLSERMEFITDFAHRQRLLD